MKKIVLTGLSVLLLASCSTITIQPTEHQKLGSKPSYEQSVSFFFWGLVGEHKVNVKEICQDTNVVQMQTQNSFVDGLLAGLTFGIYTPRSVKVWCE